MREYGKTKIIWIDPASKLFVGLYPPFEVWMSHQDEITEIPPGFKVTALTEYGTVAAVEERPVSNWEAHWNDGLHCPHGMPWLGTCSQCNSLEELFVTYECPGCSYRRAVPLASWLRHSGHRVHKSWCEKSDRFIRLRQIGWKRLENLDDTYTVIGVDEQE